MRNKKILQINRFDNFNKETNDIVTQKFYNYFPSSQLKNSRGIASALFPKSETSEVQKELNISMININSIQGISYFKQYFPDNKSTAYRLLVYGDDKRVYINQLADNTFDLFWLYSLEFETAPITLAFKKDDTDAIIIASEDKMKIWKTGFSPYTIENAPIITSMCMNEGVLFCTIKDPAFKIWYATDLRAENVGSVSNTSGYISLEDDLGYAKKVITFDEGVYVFREYGISKITYLKNEMVVSQVYVSNTKIHTNTVSICGNNILFMTQDGLYSFNGVKVKKTDIELINKFPIENVGAVASSLGENYYLALKLNFEDEKMEQEKNCINNVLLIVNTENFSYEIIRGVDIKALLPVKHDIFEKMLTIFNTGPVNKIGEVVNRSCFMENNLSKFWASEELAVGLNTKLFTKLSVDADVNIKFKLIFDEKEVDFTTYKKGVNEFIFKEMSKNAKLEISSLEESAVVKDVAIEYYEY